MDTTSVLNALGGVIEKHKPEVQKAVGSVENITDEQLDTLAGRIHPLLPMPVRMFLRKDKLGAFLVKNRDRVVPILKKNLS